MIHRLGAGDYATTLLPPSDALSLFHPRRATSRPKVWLHHCQGASGPTCPGAKGANAADADGGSGGGVYRNDGSDGHHLADQRQHSQQLHRQRPRGA